MIRHSPDRMTVSAKHCAAVDPLAKWVHGSDCSRRMYSHRGKTRVVRVGEGGAKRDPAPGGELCLWMWQGRA